MYNNFKPMNMQVTITHEEKSYTKKNWQITKMKISKSSKFDKIKVEYK